VQATQLKGIESFKAKDYCLPRLQAASWLHHFTLVNAAAPHAPAESHALNDASAVTSKGWPGAVNSRVLAGCLLAALCEFASVVPS
jgi:hypothetical protein